VPSRNFTVRPALGAAGWARADALDSAVIAPTARDKPSAAKYPFSSRRLGNVVSFSLASQEAGTYRSK
jgi:hypothetical protein